MRTLQVELLSEFPEVLRAGEQVEAVLAGEFEEHTADSAERVEVDVADEDDELVLLLVGGKIARKGKVTAYVCTAQTCKLPTTDPAVMIKQLTERPRAPK